MGGGGRGRENVAAFCLGWKVPGMNKSVNFAPILSNPMPASSTCNALFDMVALPRSGGCHLHMEISHSSILSTLASETPRPSLHSVDTVLAHYFRTRALSLLGGFDHVSCMVSFHETREHITASSSCHKSGCPAIRSTREDIHLANMAPTRPIQITKNPDSNHFFLWLSFLARSELDLIVFPQVSAVRVTRLQA